MTENNLHKTNSAKSTKIRKWCGYLLKYGVPLFISVGLCWLLFKKTDFSSMVDTIRNECDFRWILMALLFNIIAMLLRAVRWGLQLKSLGIYPPMRALVMSIFGTYAVNLVLPRLGEIWRSGYIAHRQDKPFTTVFGSMIGDRLADTITVLILGLLTMLIASKAITMYFSQSDTMAEQISSFISSPWLWVSIILIIIPFCIFMKLKTHVKWICRIQKIFRELWQGIIIIVKMPSRWYWLILTVGVWGCYYLSMWFAFRSFGFTLEALEIYGPVVVLVTFVLSSVSMGVPSNGGIGPWQWAVIFALGIYGVPAVKAGAFANVLLGATTLMQIILGLLTFAGIALDRRRTSSPTGPAKPMRREKNNK